MKDIVLSIGTLAAWWVVGYSVQTAAKILGDKTPQPATAPPLSSPLWDDVAPRGHVGVAPAKDWSEAA